MTPADFRARFGLEQTEAARLFGISRRGWQVAEKRGHLSGPARVLAIVLARRPELMALVSEIVDEPGIVRLLVEGEG